MTPDHTTVLTKVNKVCHETAQDRMLKALHEYEGCSIGSAAEVSCQSGAET